MNRNIAEQLNTFFRDGTQLLVYGARGVGKTYSVTRFVKDNALNYLYINFETDANASAFFEKTDRSTLSDAIKEYYQLDDYVLQGLFFIFDEIWSCKGFIRLLNALNGDEPIRYIAVSSKRIVGINPMLHSITLFPMGFDEYLGAIGKEWYVEVIEGHFAKEKALPRLIHDELTDIYDDYLRIGGMPSAVLESISSDSCENLESVQMNVVRSLFCEDRLKTRCSDDIVVQRANELIDYMPKELIEGRKKFTFSSIRKGLSFADYVRAINKLRNDFSVIVQSRMGEDDSFRLYPVDHGILNTLIRSNVSSDEERIRDILLYASVLSTLAGRYESIEYWSSGNSAYVDFVVHNRQGKLIPIKINISGSNRSKSLKIFMENNGNDCGISVGNTEFYRAEGVLQVPFYAAFLL